MCKESSQQYQDALAMVRRQAGVIADLEAQIQALQQELNAERTAGQERVSVAVDL